MRGSRVLTKGQRALNSLARAGNSWGKTRRGFRTYLKTQAVAIPSILSIVLFAQDVDGDENGGDFATKTQTITVKSSDYKGASGNWNDGEAEKTADFILELKPENNESE